MTYGTVAEVAAEVGRLPESVTTAETAQWTRWLERVERDIEARFVRAGMSLSGQVALQIPDAGTVADVEVAAVARKVQNPTGVSSSTGTVTVDDGTVSNTRRYESTRTGMDPLELSDAEWARLLPAGPRRVAAFSVMPS